MNPFANIGRATLTVLAHIGRLAQFTGQALAGVVSPPIYTRLILAQMVRIGYFSLPVVGLTAFFTGGVLGGYAVSVYTLDFNGTSYLKNTVDFAHQEDITSGLIKAAVFGFIVALLGCFNGFNSKGGAQGVGTATTNAVVGSSILILAADYVLTALLFHK